MGNIIECFSIVGLIIISALVLGIGTVIIELCVKLHFHRCPHCGRRMHYDHLHEGDTIEESWYEFRCDHCGAYDKINVETLHK